MYHLTVPSPSQLREQQQKLQQQQHINHQIQQLKITKHTFSDIQGLQRNIFFCLLVFFELFLFLFNFTVPTWERIYLLVFIYMYISSHFAL